MAGCSAPSTPSRKSAKASTCSVEGRSRTTGARSSSTPSSSAAQSCAVASERCSASEVAPFSRSCSTASLAAFASTDLDLRPHVPRTGARRSPRGGEPVEVGRAARSVRRRCRRASCGSGPPRRRSRARRHRGGGPCAARQPWPPPTPLRRTRRRRRRAGGSPPGLQLLGLVESTVGATRQVGHAAQDRPAQWRGSLARAMDRSPSQPRAAGRFPAGRDDGPMCSRPPFPSVVVMPDVFLHVGSVQDRDDHDPGRPRGHGGAARRRGVLFPGGHRAQRLAAYDLLGQRVGGEQRGEAAGALGRLVDLVDSHDGPTVVVSEEELSLARPRQARRLVRALAGHRVHVVIGARDMARTLVSAWQQTIVNGGTTTWADFVASVRGQEGAPPSEGVSFHWRHDLLRVVDTWSSAVPAERIRLVTVPPRGTPGTALLTRFAAAADLPAGWPGEHQVVRNVSLGAAELEVVRRLNEAVGGTFNATQHRFVIEAGIRSRLAGATARPLELPPEHLAWTRVVRRTAGGRARTPRPHAPRRPVRPRAGRRRSQPAPPSTTSRTPSCSPPRARRWCRWPSTTGSCSAATGARSSSARVDCRDPPRC